MDETRFTRRLELSRATHRELLTRLDGGHGGAARPDANARARARHAFPEVDIPIVIQHPQGGVGSFLVYGRNISRSGIAILHGGYVHRGSTCKVVLDRADGTKLLVAGVVCHCRLISGSCHEVGVRFFEEIDPAVLRHRPPPSDDVGDDDPEAVPSIALPRMTGSVLVAEPFPPDLELLKHQLCLFGPKILEATSADAMLDLLRREPVDVVLFGLGVRPPAGPTALETIAATTEFAGSVLLLTAETDPATLEAACRAGADRVVPKPYDLELLLAELQASLGTDGLPAALPSTASRMPGMPPLLVRYIEFARRSAEDLKELYNAREWPTLLALCHRLRGSGCGYGFPRITGAATSAITELNIDVTTPRARAALARLIECCRALTVASELDHAA